MRYENSYKDGRSTMKKRLTARELEILLQWVIEARRALEDGNRGRCRGCLQVAVELLLGSEKGESQLP
jgi:hypothetical protein